MSLKTMTDDVLILEAKSLHNQIFVVDCYNTKDMVELEAIYQELELRGYDVNETSVLEVTKSEQED